MTQMEKLMEDTKLPEDVLTEILNWFSGFEFEFVHVWYSEYTWYVVIVSEDDEVDMQRMHFLRLWRNVFNKEISLSEDRQKVVSFMSN